MKIKLFICTMMFIVATLILSTCFAEGFADISLSGEKFIYNGQEFNTIIIVRNPNAQNNIDADDVVAIKIISDKIYGKILIIKEKSRQFEIRLIKIRNILSTDDMLFIDI